MFSDIELEGMTIDKKILKEKSIEIKTQIYSLESDILLELGETRESINLESNLFDDFEKLESGLIEGSDITDWGTIGIRGSKEINKSFKLGSSDQLGKKLEILGWDIKSRNIKGLPNTGVDQLTEWAKQGRTLATKLLKYRELCKMLSTYIGIEEKKSGMYKWIRDDGKIHSLYNNFGALSWRHTSSQPNGQNWVSHGEKAEVIRSFITPKNNPLYGFSSTDFSGLQLRLIGMVSNDSEMVTTFKVKGGDLHIRTAFNIFLKYLMGIETLEDAVELKEIKDDTGKLIKDYRFKSKSANFGFVFGASALTALTTTIKPNWSKDDALKYVIANGLESEANNYYQRIISGKIKQLQKSQDKDENYTTSLYCAVANDVRTKFFETYTGLADWIDLTREEAKLKGYVQSVYGSIRRLPYLLINHEDADINRGYFHGLLNVCLNSPIQTMESIIMNRSLLIIWRWIKDNKLEHKIFGQIHDAMEFFSLLTDKQALINKIHEVCETDYPEYKGLLLEVESNISDYYGKNELWDMGKNIASTVE
jgi:DNA polymerase I-like protein with 3'-5' exonuclease and polymerase domains